MRKILKNNAKTQAKLAKLPKMYLIGCWAGYGIREYAYAGKCDKDGVPYVWDYYDGNGRCDEWHMRLIIDTTTGVIYGWSTDKSAAERMARLANIAKGEDWRNT